MRYHPFQFPFDPNLPTEETMFRRLCASGKLGDEYVLCGLPLAHMINVRGIAATQKEIDGIRIEGKKLFVCQHILSHRLHFDDDSLLATPHAAIGDTTIPIPHYPVNVDTSKIAIPRGMKFSFMGSLRTHPVRTSLARLFPENCFDSQIPWGLDDGVPDRERFRERYVLLLGQSEFSLCPRGTGRSTVRLFESIAMGAVPVIVADGYRPPLENIIDWKNCSVRVRVDEVEKLMQILSEYSVQKIHEMSIYCQNVFRDYLCPEKFEKSIELYLP